MRPLRRARPQARTIAALLCASIAALTATAGCRTAVIAEPKDDATQTIVTVEHRPATQPSDKGLIVRDR